MHSIPKHTFMRWPATLIVAGALAASSGCQLAPTAKPDIAPPYLELIESEPLVLAEDCAAGGSFFVEFTVLKDGRTGNIQAPAGPACVQQALTAWVSSFRYSPIAGEFSAAVEWMLVTAQSGS